MCELLVIAYFNNIPHEILSMMDNPETVVEVQTLSPVLKMIRKRNKILVRPLHSSRPSQ
jgi:hypothetical protein